MRTKLIFASLCAVLVLASVVQATTYIGAETEPWIVPPFSEATYTIGQYNSTHYYAKNFTGYGTTANAGYEFLSTDPSTVINNALGKATDVKITDGLYSLSVALTPQYNNTVLEGQSWNTTLKLAIGANCRIISASAKSGLVIRNLQLDGNYVNQVYSGNRGAHSGIFLDYCDNALVENVYIHDTMAGAAISFSNSTSYSKALNNRIINCGNGTALSDGIYEDGDYNTIQNNYVQNVTDTGSANDWNTVNLKGSWGKVIGNTIVNCTVGIQSWYGSQHFTIQDNKVINSTDENLYIKGGPTQFSADFKIETNTFSGTGSNYVGVHLRNLTASTISGNTIELSGQAGIFLEGMGTGNSNLTISENTIRNNGKKGSGERQGIDISDDNTAAAANKYITIENNRIYDDQATQTQVWAIKEERYSDYNIIRSNDARGNINDPCISVVGTHTVVYGNRGFDIPGIESSYMILKVNTTYYSQTSTGAIISTNTDFATVLNATVGSYREIYIPNGHYDLAGRVVISTSYLTVEGESYGGVNFHYGAQGTISLEGTASLLGVIFRNINFTDGGTTALNPAISSVNQTDDSRVELTLDYCKITGFRNSGVYMLNIKNGERVRLLHSYFDSEGRITVWNGSLINLYSTNYFAGNWEFTNNFFNARYAYGSAFNITGSIFGFTTKELNSIYCSNNQFYLDQDDLETYASADYAYWINAVNSSIRGFRSVGDRTENVRLLKTSGGNDTKEGVIEGGDFGMQGNSTYPFIYLNQYTWSWIIQGNQLAGSGTMVGIDDDNIYTDRFNEIHGNIFRASSGTPTWIIASTGGTIVKDNVGFVTENAGNQASCVNGTWIPHGLSGTPTTITISIYGTNPYINASANYFVPTVITANSTHFQVSFCFLLSGTQYPVTAAEAKTIFWDAVYKP